MAPGEMLKAFDDALEIASRWPRLIKVLKLDRDTGKPGPVSLNDALEARGFRRVLDERSRLSGDYPDAWWSAVARETCGRADATVDEVVAALKARSRS